MRPLISLLLLGLGAISPISALTEYDAVVLVKSFADSLMSPANVAVAQQGNSSLFAPDVQGRIDIIGE